MTSADDEEPLQATNNPDRDHKSKRFRFKRKQGGAHESSGSRHRTDDHTTNRQQHHHHHRSKKRKVSNNTVNDPAIYDDSVADLPPDTAFRESLFDALGDDEGAAFWEGVYGQPIHNFPDSYSDPRTGELEQMDDEQYAQHVRRKMWEKSWEGIEAAKEEQRQERQREKEKIRNDEKSRVHREQPTPDESYLFDLDIEQSLRRGERRKNRKRHREMWSDYLRRWEGLQVLREASKTMANEEPVHLRNKIAWPVETGKRSDVNTQEVERFIKHCAEAADDGDVALMRILKSERVRWHPDKIQQRYGFMSIDEGTVQSVTAVFQIIDRMWSEVRTQD